MKYFNIEGACDPKEHYMVDLQSRLERIKVFIERGKYFSINRARQYGKTTVLTALAQYLSAGYIVISMDFQMLSHADFKSETNFVQVFIRELFISISDYEESIAENTKEKFSMILHGGKEERTLSNMFRLLSQWIENLKKPVVLIIDEVDSASNNQVFLDFLAQLRGYYLQRKRRGAFQSVILAGVYDIKNLQLKIRPQEEHRYNSPWNIAVEFDIDMSFGQKEIAGMLAEYEQDHHTGMEIEIISRQIREYTSGYPFLVSRICKTLDEEYNADWSEDAVRRAVKELMFETNTLFDDVIKKIENDRKFSSMVEKVIFSSKLEPFRISNPLIGRGVMFGIFSEKDGYVVISNKLFEMYLYEYFISVNRPIKEPVITL